MAQKRGPGAPKKPPGETMERHVTIWLTASQHEMIVAAAEAEDDRPGNWGRRALLRVARETLESSSAPEKRGKGGR